MKRFLTFLALCCLMAAGAWAERYHIYQNNGTLHTTGSSTFCSQWTSTQTDPQISINVTDGNGAANDMQNNSTYADGGIVCYTGNDRDKQGYKATLTVAASHGYNITGYEFDASSLTDGCTISVSDGTTTKTLTGTTAQTISKTGVNAQNFVITIQCTAGSNRNTAVLFNNFYVTYEAAEPIENEYKVVFETPSSGTPYRIPAVAQAQNGDLIFVSDYRYSKADIGMATNGELDLKVRKKKANGTWEDEKTLQRCITTAPFTAFGDPCIVVDNTPGNPGKVMVTSCCGNVSYPHGSHSNHQGWARWYSTDNGDTWSSYTDISQQVVNQVDQRTGAKLAAFFIGSGKISQSKTIKVNNYNRLYCASLTTVSPDGADANKATMNYVWYSDDFGENWHMLGTPDGNPINGGNEPKAEELPDGSVLISSRTSGGRIYNIWHYTDTEAGKGYWGTQQKCTATYGADCNGEILVVPVTRASNSEKTYLLLQSIPADANRNYVSIYWKELTDLTKYRTAAELSNGGWTKFPVSTTTSAYSTMCQMKDGHIAFFYEEYDHNSGYDMVYKNFSVEEITNNAYSYSTLDATEKANYLTNGVGAYFDGESSAVQALAATYKAAPDADKYDALNAALQSPDELYFTPGWYRIKVGSGSAQKQAEYKGRYLYGKPLPDTWPIGVTDNANDLRTYVYITGTHDKWHIEFNHDTDAAYFATHDCKNSATPGNLSFIPNSEGTEWKIWGNNSYRWMGWQLNSTPSIGSTSTDNDTNNGCYFVFEKVDAPVLVAGKVYKIKAKFATGTSDIYLSAGSTGMTLPTAEATTPQSYWIARTTNDATYPWKFQSGYGNGKYLSVANGVSETASTFDVRTCADVSGTYHLWNSQSGGRYIGTYSSTNSKHGFGDFDGKGCWADGHHAGSDYTTDYIFEEVQNVTAYTVCGEGSLNVTGITGYTYASEISAGGVVIVPSNITPTASNFTTPDGLIAIVNTDAKTITLSKTYKKGVAVTQQSDLQNGDLVIVDVKAKNATTDAVLYYVGESTSMSNRNNFRAHIYNVTEYPANHVWEVVDVNTSTTPNTFKLRSVADNTVYLPSGNTTSATNTAATFYFKESTGYNDGVNRFALAFSNNENADHYTYHFNAQPATGQGEPICFWGYGAASTDSQGAFAFYKVAEDIPTAEISLDNTTVTSSQLSELTITFTGDNAAQVQLSATQHTAYLTPKASTPAQVKSQNGKFKAAPAGAIEGNISATDETGKFSINFGDADIAAGDYELSIPEGTFLVGTTPVPELTANYTVEESAPALPPYANLPLASGVYEIQNSPTMSGGNRGYLVDYTSYTNGPSLAECHYSGCENKHPNAKNDGSTTSSKWYVYNDNGTYYIVSLSTLGSNTDPQFLKPGATNSAKSEYSTSKVALTVTEFPDNTVTGADGQTYHSYRISATSGIYLCAACGTNSTSGAVTGANNANDGGVPWVFIPCDESTLTTEQVALRDKAIEIINYKIPTAGKVYTIKAHFTSDSYTDIYLTSDTGAEQLLLPMPTTATANQSYWVAEASGNTDRPWKFKSGYGYAKYLDWQSGTNGLSANGDNFGVLDCGTVPGTYHLNVSTNDRNIGTWGNNNNTKKGFGAVGSGGCWAQNKGHYNGLASGNYWTTDYEIVEVTGVKAYLVSCDNTNGGVAPKFSDYAGVATVKNGGYIIVPNGTTLNATNFPAAEISGYTGSVIFNGTTITVTYEASATPDGFHIYESNGTYSNTASSSAYKDKWLSKGTNPQFTILVTQASGSGAANNMYHNETYKDSGILCFTGDAHINNKSMMTVSVQNGYKITGYTFKVKNLEGATAGNTKVVTTAGQTINTTADNQTVVVSGLEDVTSFTITLDGSNGSRNEGIVFTDFYVTYEGEPVVEVPATGIYYIYDNNKSGYLYNNSITSEGTSELTETLTGTKVTDDNRYLWRVVSDGSSTSITLTNGQGTGYKVSDADETHTVDLASVNWKFEELPMITIRPQGKPAYDEYPVHYVSVKYKSKTEAIEKVLDEGYAKYTDGNTQYAHNGGFLVDRDDWKASNFGYGDASSRICEEDGLPFTKCRIYTNADTENTNHWWYYTQQDEDLITEIQQKITYFPYETDMLGLVEESSIPWDNENLMAVVYAAMADWFEAYEYKEMLGRFNRLVAAVEVVKPTIGNGYKLYVKDKDGNKYYLANDKVTANADEAEVYVVGGTDDESCNYLFASNNNGASNYLPNMSSAGSTYEEDACAYKIQGMGQITGENVEEEAAFLYGSFLLTNAEGNILNAITGSSASLNPRTEPYVVYGESSTETSAIWMEEVEYPYNKPTLAKGSPDDHDGGYASIWLPFPMLFPDGVEAYRATSVENDGILILTKVNTDRMVAAGGYILRDPDQKDDKASWTVLPAAANPKDVTPFEDNAFVGSTEKPLEVKEEGSWAAFREKHPDGTAYVLARKNGVIGYYKYKETESYLPKGKAIWFSNYEPSTSTECMQFSFGDIVEAIKALNGEATDAEIYDLQGHRLNKAVKGQVNVINGKKVMFK